MKPKILEKPRNYGLISMGNDPSHDGCTIIKNHLKPRLNKHENKRNKIHGFLFKLLIPTSHVSNKAIAPIMNKMISSIDSVNPWGRSGRLYFGSELIFRGSGDRVSEFGLSKKASDMSMNIVIDRIHFVISEL